MAGSIRRHAPLVADIELLAVPKVEPITDLLGERPGSERNRLDAAVQALLDARVLGVRHALGSRYKGLSYKGEAVDLFVCLAPAQWGVLKLLRTGPAEFSKRFVTRRTWGGWLPDDLVCLDGALHGWDDLRGEALDTPEERDAFAAAGLDWLPPHERTPTVEARFGGDGRFLEWRDRGPRRDG